MTASPSRGAMRFYRALLHLYPAGFRVEFRHELARAFAERAREYTGPLAPVLTILAAIADVVPNAASAHWEILRQDLAYATRTLRRAPGFALTAVLVIALGVGANTAAFSLADFVLLRPLAFREPDRVVRLWETTPGYSRMELSPANYRDWKAAATSFTGMAAYTGRAVNLAGDGEPRRLETARITPELMSVLGVGALAGRTITPDDSANDQVVVLSHALWQTYYGGDPTILGKAIRLDALPYTVVGIMPPTFRFPDRAIEAWTPLVFREQNFADRTDNFLAAVARLAPGVSIARANQEIALIARRLEQQYPRANEKTGGIVVSLRDELSERARLLVLALCGASLCILLLACANLGSLLLARAAQRSRELAVRSALGAGRERLLRQLLTESSALVAIGGVVGVAMAIAGLPLLSRLVPSALPVAEDPSVDMRVLAVAAVVVVVTSVIFGAGPAILAGRSTALDTLRSGARAIGRTQRVRALLVTVELAASVMLLISSGLLMRAMLRIQATDPGFRTEHVLTLRTALPWSRYGVTATREQFYDRVLRDVQAIPGVERAAYTSGLPMVMRGGIWPVSLRGEELMRGENSASLRFVTPGYFETLGIPRRAGRDVADTDTRDRPFVAVVSESFARRQWPNESPLGKRFMFALSERTVVGVVGDVRVRGLERTSEPQVYVSYRQVPDSSLMFYTPKDLVVRSTVSPAAILPAIRRAIAAADPEQPVSDVHTMAEIVATETAARATQVRLLGALSVVALLIAGVGIHGLLAFAVSQRSRELSVRRALGEPTGSIVRRVLGEGMMLAGAGVMMGAVAAYFGARGMAALLAGVQPQDPATIVGAAVLCLTTAVVGCLRPAIRAGRVDPITALKGE